MKKYKINRVGDCSKSNKFDQCQTPAYALDPLIPFIPRDWKIWEPAAGEGNIVSTLMEKGFNIFGSDILNNENFFLEEREDWDCIITNPPYSIKYKWIEYCYKLNKPFALLLPIDTIGSGRAQKLFDKFGIEIILLSRRVNFIMPIKGLSGRGAQFSTAWFTWKFNLGSQLIFRELIR
jgi:hypothetical protein